MSQEVLMVVGFLLGSYSIVGNDAIQTLGTFLSSNSHRPWWVLWLFAGSVITVVLVYGWVAHSGDVSYGRLEAIPVPEHFSWIYCVPPFVLLLLTRWGIPVSTTFLTLTIFAPKALESMLLKSLLGYATKELSHIPMSTTWVFVGLLAGREIAIAWNERHRSRQEVSRLVLSDFAKIVAGLVVSVALALLLPKLL